MIPAVMPRSARLLTALGAILLVGVLVTPIWRIGLTAPQYPEGLSMVIRANTVSGGREHDLENVNKLNHYIGMRPIDAGSIPELRAIPWIIGTLAACGVLVAVIGRRRLLVGWVAALGAFGVAGLADFWRWGYDYGHHLDFDDAIIKVPGMTYQPPLIGTKQLLNFSAVSWPSTGAVLAGLAFGLGVAALLLSRRRVAVLPLLAFAAHSAAGQVTREVWPADGARAISVAVAQAAPGSRIIVHGGVHHEPTIVVDKRLELIGADGPVLDGDGVRGLLVVSADDVTVRGFVLRNTGMSFVDDRAALEVTGVHGCLIADNRVERAFFAIHLTSVTDCRIAHNVLHATTETETRSGNGIHLWSSRRITIEDNEISGHRDGIYFEFVHDSEIRRNLSEHNLRYGLHFMYSDDCRYEGNTFRWNGSGVAVMYTKRVEMIGNRFQGNWGPAAYGLLLKEIGDSRLTGNVFRENTTGLLADGANRLVAEGNAFESNGWALKLEASTQDGRFARNNFVDNTFDVSSNSRSQSTTFVGNYWSDYRGYDLDRDGRGDVPHRPVRMFSLIVEHHPAALMLLRSAFVGMLDVAERAFPSLTPETLVDAAPAMRRIQ